MANNEQHKIESLKNYIRKNGKTDTWANMADQFNVFQDRDNKPKGDAVRSIFRNIRKDGERSESKPIQNLVLKSKWQNAGGEWLESYKAIGDPGFDINEFRKQLVSDIANIKKPKQTKYDRTRTDGILYEICLPDFHFGKIDGLSIQEQSDLFLDAIQSLVNKASGLNIERILLPLGNDIFNSDNLNYTTTKGTPQRDNSSWQESFRAGWKTVVTAINYLEEIAPVDVVMISGNHDTEKTFYLGELLLSYYNENPNVRVDNSLNSPRKYYIYKDILLGFTHGDKEKLADLPLIMAREVPTLWAQSNYREFHTGHLHKQETTEYQGVVIRILPALCGQDEWHKLMGYNSERKCQAYVWGSEGLEGYFQKNY